jgi:hypothetical protein
MEMNDHMKEMMSKLWSKDITSLTMQEINDLICNMFYQIFLVDVHHVQFKTDTGVNGCTVEFFIQGEAFKDEANIDVSDDIEIQEILQQMDVNFDEENDEDDEG